VDDKPSKPRKGDWARLLRFANASERDDPQLVAQFTNLLDTFGIVPELRGLPARQHSGLAKNARMVQKGVHVLLRYLLGDQTASRRARDLLAEHRGHFSKHPVLQPVDVTKTRLAARPGKSFVKRKAEGWTIIHRERRRKHVTALPRELSTIVQFRDALDPVCHFVDHAIECGEVPPIGYCRNCQDFFPRRGRARYCSPNCHSAFYRMDPIERREYQYRYRAERLLKSEGRQALHARIKQVRRRQITEAKRQSILKILHSVLRRSSRP